MAQKAFELGGEIVGVRNCRLGLLVVAALEMADVGGDFVVLSHRLVDTRFPRRGFLVE